MTIPELYEYLCSPQFQDEKSGNIFYNYYIYQYPANKEYEMRRQVQEFKEKLERPTNFVDALVLDLFKVFCEYLSNEKFGDTSLLEDTFEEDKMHPDMVTRELTTEAKILLKRIIIPDYHITIEISFILQEIINTYASI